MYDLPLGDSRQEKYFSDTSYPQKIRKNIITSSMDAGVKDDGNSIDLNY